MSSAVLEAADLGCTLGGRPILSRVNLRLEAGEILGIIGPNGAGKSTLLRCLTGLLPVTGSIELHGRPLASLGIKERARELALMHQNTGTGFPLPASEVVMMGRYAHQGRFHSESAEDRRIVAEAMRFTSTTPLAGQPLSTLSGGERQRVLLAKALAQSTPILLLDEPSASLDIAHQDQIFRFARKLAAEGKAIVAAIHDLRLAARYCHRVLLLSQGRVAGTGTPEAVLTASRLEAAYGASVHVYRNPMTGHLDFHLDEPESARGRIGVHVIGGGGTASRVFRLLGSGNYRVTTGVLSPGDTDLQVAGFYQIPAVTASPFSPIDDRAFAENQRLAADADLTIVCNLAVGAQNLRNLEAAASAQKLVILEDDAPEDRDFTGGEGLALYRRLVQGATVLKTDDLAAWLEGS